MKLKFKLFENYINKEDLLNELVQWYLDYDPYEFYDNYETFEDALEEYAEYLNDDDSIHSISEEISDIINQLEYITDSDDESNNELIGRGKLLISNLTQYHNEDLMLDDELEDEIDSELYSEEYNYLVEEESKIKICSAGLSKEESREKGKEFENFLHSRSKKLKNSYLRGLKLSTEINSNDEHLYIIKYEINPETGADRIACANEFSELAEAFWVDLEDYNSVNISFIDENGNPINKSDIKNEAYLIELTTASGIEIPNTSQNRKLLQAEETSEDVDEDNDSSEENISFYIGVIPLKNIDSSTKDIATDSTPNNKIASGIRKAGKIGNKMLTSPINTLNKYFRK